MAIKNNPKNWRKFNNKNVEAVFNRYPPAMRTKLMAIRELIFQTAEKTPGVGELEETLKWGQPSYLTMKSKSGTTIRIDQISPDPGVYGIFVHCQTTLIGRFRPLYPTDFTYEKNRGIHFGIHEQVPVKELQKFIVMALTYHQK